MYIYILNKHGEPLMPCNPRKARVLLQSGKATVVKRTPFTIQLKYGSSGYIQPISLGMDAGSKHIGIAATTKKQVLYAEELEPRNDVVKLLSVRRQNRHTRRSRRKTGYFDIRRLDGTKANNGSISYKKLDLKEKAQSYLIERRMCIPPLPTQSLEVGVSCT